MADHALITKLIIHWSRDCACTDHKADNSLITWLIMHWSRAWLYYGTNLLAFLWLVFIFSRFIYRSSTSYGAFLRGGSFFYSAKLCLFTYVIRMSVVLSFYCWKVFHDVDIPWFVYLLIYWWVVFNFGLLKMSLFINICTQVFVWTLYFLFSLVNI